MLGTEQFAFDQPQRLWLLLLVPASLLCLRLLRRRAAVLTVPSLALWRIALGRVQRRELRWLRRLVLLLQFMVLCGLVLLWAGPHLHAISAGRGTTLVIVDRSLGTLATDASGVPLSQHVLESANALVRAARLDGLVGLGWISDGLHAAGTVGDDAAVDAALADPPMVRGARALEALAVLAESAAAPKRVVWVSPFAVESSMRTRLSAAGLFFVHAGTPLPQAGIVAVERDGPEVLAVTVKGTGTARTLRLFADGQTPEKLLGEWAVAPTATGVRCSVVLPPAAPEALRLQLEPADSFPQDDVARVALPERRRVAVMLVTDLTSNALDACFAASECVDHARSGRMAPADFGTTPFAADVVVLHGVHSAQPLPPGRYFLIDSSAEGLALRTQPSAAVRATLLDVSSTDPLVRGLSFADLDMPALPLVQGAPAAQIIVRTSAGPLLARGTCGEAEFIALLCPLERSHSNLTSLPLFPLLLDAALRGLARPTQALMPAVANSGGCLLLLPGEATQLTAEGAAVPQVLSEREDATGFVAPAPGWWRTSQGRLVATALLDAAGAPTQGWGVAQGAPQRVAQGAPQRAAFALPAFAAQETNHSLRTELAAVLLLLLLLEWSLPLIFRQRSSA